MTKIKLLKKLIAEVKSGYYDPYFEGMEKAINNNTMDGEAIEANDMRIIVKDFLENRLIEAEDEEAEKNTKTD